MMDFAIETESLVKAFPKVRALDGVNMRVPKGSVYGFLGRNGAGKSTTMRILLGLARATSGTARVLGMESAPDQTRILERTAFVGERKSLHESMTPAQLVRFTKAFYPRWQDASVEKYAKRLEIPMNQRCAELSNGNRTKVSIMLGLAQGAELLMLDEPTSGLDPVFRDELLRTLVDEHVGDGHTVFFSSHDLTEVEQIADWIGIIDHGRVLLEAPMDEVRANFRLVIAAGNGLPTSAENVACMRENGAFREYVVSRDAEGFASRLRQQGGTVTEVQPMTLREVFLALVRREEQCTTGKVGATASTDSSRC